MTSDQVATLLLVRNSTIEDHARRGVLPPVKLGRPRRYMRSDVLHALDELRGCRA